MLIFHSPGFAFKPQFNASAFPDMGEKFTAWCGARTGYPLIDDAIF
jgi:deoxyribodipyrimidine photolyase